MFYNTYLKIWWIFVTCMILISMLTAVVHGSDNEVVLKLLLKKGVITQEEYEELMLDVKDDKTMEEKIAEIEKKTENLAKEHKALKQSHEK
ncbi:MAG TPA: hypothetical protein VJL89_08885, partial [Thermodesulfovibrionia bacterium]|nr:hypothetical protein [Thermodesulfovibrionia bacterium]